MIAKQTISPRSAAMLTGRGRVVCAAITRSTKATARPNVIRLLVEGATLTHYATDSEVRKWREGHEYNIQGELARQEYNGKLVINIRHVAAADKDTPPFRLTGEVRVGTIEPGDNYSRIGLLWMGGDATVSMSPAAASSWELDAIYSIVAFLVIDGFRGGLALRVQGHRIGGELPTDVPPGMMDQVTGEVEDPEEVEEGSTAGRV